jgi:hypothetical protein
MIMYIASPGEAAKMPVFRKTVPSSLSGCLHDNPTSIISGPTLMGIKTREICTLDLFNSAGSSPD